MLVIRKEAALAIERVEPHPIRYAGTTEIVTKLMKKERI
jgi:hypothetical protein